MFTSTLRWNPRVKLILSDVDETVADLYVRAEPEMVRELSKVLDEGIVLFLITGQGLKSVLWRVIDPIPKKLRHKILIGHCSGAEVLSFATGGELANKTYYSLYKKTINSREKTKWREIMQKVIEKFKLKIYPTMPVKDFQQKAKSDPFAVMHEDRGAQITFEFVNGYDLNEQQKQRVKEKLSLDKEITDLRIPVLEYSNKTLHENNIPITARTAGVFGLDFAISGVSKTTAVQYILQNDAILRRLNLPSDITSDPDLIEIWGDKFSVARGGTDRHMSEAVSPRARSLTFRAEDPSEFLPGYNIVVWNGFRNLQEGLLEYLRSRHK
ncbi:hypothetical protein HY214_03275 [Candidatus Roizmanbacteria bacterium]|nr:hypothetical protein [Candidatus Roizmanbacteria bacterium]